jgi:hypothetical protein
LAPPLSPRGATSSPRRVSAIAAAAPSFSALLADSYVPPSPPGSAIYGSAADASPPVPAHPRAQAAPASTSQQAVAAEPRLSAASPASPTPRAADTDGQPQGGGSGTLLC